ncbi:molecular chaperone [Shewanella mangrovisoli]|uniref:TorD/DmsD family molecular chaperone n=1 Tax=Shewanella mangrovisoli TaxID=2864211 RepID=UPI0035B888A5
MSKIKADDYLTWGAIAKVLHNILYTYPEAPLIDNFKQDELHINWPQLVDSEYEKQGRTYLGNYLSHWQSTEAQLTELKVDYGQLFFGPSDPKAAPWGSVYTGEEQSLNGDSTQKLMAFYKAHNIEFTLARNEPIDHIGLILLTLEYLFNQLAATPEDKNILGTCTLLLQQHLLPWADRCLELAEQHADSEFYKGIAILSRVYLEHVSQHLGIIKQQSMLFR